MERFDMEELKPALAAEAIGVPLRNIHYWLRTGALVGKQNFTGKWTVTVASLRAFVRARPYAADETMAKLDAWLNRRYGNVDSNGRKVVHA